MFCCDQQSVSVLFLYRVSTAALTPAGPKLPGKGMDTIADELALVAIERLAQ